MPNPDLPIPGDDVKMTVSSMISQNKNNLEPNDVLRQSRMRSQMLMSHMSAAVAQRKAYLEMNYALYLTISLSMYVLIVLLAMVLEDISTIFDFVSAYAVSCIAFIIPAVFYKNAV